MAGLVLDTGTLIGLERNDRRVIAMLARVSERGDQITIPASALAQAIRQPERQVRLARLVRQPSATVVPLDRADATSIGRLLAASGTSDVVDAHVVVCAPAHRPGGGHHRRRRPRALSPRLRVVPL
jgi:hypothetical protein